MISATALPLNSQHQTNPPWVSPRTILEINDEDRYAELKDRLASIPTRSNQRRQSLYIDLWTGQHWIGLFISTSNRTHTCELLKPVSVDTALSLATRPTYKLLKTSESPLATSARQ